MEQPFEFPERVAIYAAKYFDIVKRELERCGLKPDVARRVGQHEPEVDMNEVPVAVEENVAVMPVFDLQEVCDDGVTCKNFTESREGKTCTLTYQLATV